MTDSPSPIDSSFDASDVATPCTVIAAKTRNLRDLQEEEESEEERSHGDEEEAPSEIYVDDFSKTDFSEDATSLMEPLPRPPSFARTITKVYCHMDNEDVPYMVEVHVPPDCLTLRDVKRKLTRTNYKYFCIALDPESGLEVKAELRDDADKLYPTKEGRFQLFLLTTAESVHSDNSSGINRKQKSSKGSKASSSSSRERYANSEVDSEASSLPTYLKNARAYNKRHATPQQYGDLRHHLLQKQRQKNHQYYRNQNQNPYEESSFDVTESDVYGGRDGETFYDEDDDSRSINTDLTSVSQVHLKKMYREQQARQNRWKSQMSTTSSSFTDITESSMGVEILTVRLNLESLPLGMIPCGDTDSRGDSGLFVGSIMDRGAVALDGRIDVGDMILEINGVALQNYSNQQAVKLLKEAVQRRFVTLLIAKSDKKKSAAFFRNPRNEPVRPIDTNEWIKHATNAMKAMPSISEESSSTPIPDEWPSHSSASGTPFGGPAPIHISQLTVNTDKKFVVEVMAQPGSGLEIKDREWLKIPFPMSFLGRDLVDWLLDHVKGLKKRTEAIKFAGEMLKLGYIQHVVNEKHFSEKRYYVMGEECADYTQLRAPDGGFKYPPSTTSSAPSNNNVFPPSMYQQPNQNRNSMVFGGQSGYASMPSSPFPKNSGAQEARDCGRTRDDQRSQTSGSSRGSSRRYVELPRKASSQGSNSSSSILDRVASRSSFRAAMSGSLRQFSIDN